MKNNKKVLIISGGSISLSFIKEYLRDKEFEYIIAADYGLLVAHKLDLPVDYILGDFDSVPKEIIEEYRNKQKDDETPMIRKYNPVKDYTDTQIAIEAALELDPDELVILGGSGTRLDHTLSNIQNLLIVLKRDIKCSLVDEYNKLYLINKTTKLYKKDIFGSFFSLLPLTQLVEGVTLTGFKYPLENVDMEKGYSLGVSNEVVENEAQITLDSGILIVIESRD